MSTYTQILISRPGLGRKYYTGVDEIDKKNAMFTAKEVKSEISYK